MVDWLKAIFKKPDINPPLELPDTKKFDPELHNVIRMDTKTYVGSLRFYADLYAKAELGRQYKDLHAFTLKQLLRGRHEYEKIERVTGAPWWLVGAIHGLECSFNWTRGLVNGDPLGKPTVNHPKGLVFDTWGESAIYAMTKHGAHKEFSWSMELALQFAEKYNGLGYLKYFSKHKSPYLWNTTTIETEGKYVSDHEFIPNFKSGTQVGVAAVIKLLEKEKVITPQYLCSGIIK